MGPPRLPVRRLNFNWPLLPKRLLNAQIWKHPVFDNEILIPHGQLPAMPLPNHLDPPSELRHSLAELSRRLPERSQSPLRHILKPAPQPWCRALRIQTPHHDVAGAPPVVVPLAVEEAGAFHVTATLEGDLKCRFQLREEDQVFGPRVLGCRGAGMGLCAATSGLGAEDTFAVFEGERWVAGHVVFEPEGGVGIEGVGFINVDGFLLGGEVEWWLAG